MNASTRKFVVENACRKGEPNLTADKFRQWIKDEYNCSVSAETARRWLHKLGFKQVDHHKKVYFDGHEWEDVVAYRERFVETLDSLNRRCEFADHEPILKENEKPLIIVHHDESTVYANADQAFYWSDGSSSILKQKSLGQSIMISDFIGEKSNDFLQNNGLKVKSVSGNTKRRIF